MLTKPVLFDLFSSPLASFSFESDRDLARTYGYGYGPRITKLEDDVIQYSWDVPGIEADDLSIEFESEAIRLKGKRSDTNEEIKILYSVDRTRDTESAIAELKNGVLSVKMKPKESMKPRTIKVLAK